MIEAPPAPLGVCADCGSYRQTFRSHGGRCRSCAGMEPTAWERMRAELRGVMARVEESADDGWLQQARELLREYLTSNATCHVDDWWEFAFARGLPPAEEARALGAVFGRARQLGWMQKTGRSRPSIRSHGSDKPVWRSLIYEEE